MRTSKLSLSFLASSLAPVLLAASPLPSACQCAAPSPSSWLPHLRPISRGLPAAYCELVCDHRAEVYALQPEREEDILEEEDLDPLPPPLDPTERPLPTSVLMRFSSHPENRPSAPSQTATAAPYLEAFPEHADGHVKWCGHVRAEAEIDMRASSAIASILVGLVVLFLFAVLIVELVEKAWKRYNRPSLTFNTRTNLLTGCSKPYVLFSRRGRIMLDGKEKALHERHMGTSKESHEKIRIRR